MHKHCNTHIYPKACSNFFSSRADSIIREAEIFSSGADWAKRVHKYFLPLGHNTQDGGGGGAEYLIITKNILDVASARYAPMRAFFHIY